ncbi:hypothetical protein [Allocoleopsis sp.]|uniref:hypothetical protein n=1 Tax=Allocoleopsis sp. TaxID=3088169 RepID=UPI002FCFA0EC
MNSRIKNNAKFLFFFLPAGFILGLFVEDSINYVLTYYSYLPLFYILLFIVLISLVFEALFRRKKTWVLPALIIYATVAMWYLTEAIYTPDYLTDFSNEIQENAYLQIIFFLGCFRFLLPQITYKVIHFNKSDPKISIKPFLNPKQILFYISIIWLGLLLFGISRMNGDIFAALFPINARAGINMWGRGAGASAGSSGFIISSAAYIYLLVCSFFGILLTVQTTNNAKIINVLLILISWPYFIFLGARNQFLALAMPAYFSYILLSKQKLWIKILITIVAFLALNYLFTLIIAYRDVGFSSVLSGTSSGTVAQSEQKHYGLNMFQELCFINRFYQNGTLHSQYGADYIAQFLNFVPRAIWPNKPLLGIDYAIARGFGTNRTDIGVTTTVSTGLIGQGIVNFGPYFGSLAPALLLALWAGFLARLWSQRYSALRLCLFLVGLGTTFNLGREITLLVLWPMVFGYALVRIIENLNRKKLPKISSHYY